MAEQGIVPKAKAKVKDFLSVEEPVLIAEEDHVPSGAVLDGEIED